METAPGTRRAAITRVLLTLLFWPAIAFICIIVPLAKFVLVFVPLYLLWVFVVDAVTLARGLFRDVGYPERPRFRWIFGTGLALFSVWAFLQFTPLGRRIVGQPESTLHFNCARTRG